MLFDRMLKSFSSFLSDLNRKRGKRVSSLVPGLGFHSDGIVTNPFPFLSFGFSVFLFGYFLRMFHSLLLSFAKAREKLMAGRGIEINLLGIAIHFSPFRLRPHNFDALQ